MFSPTASGCGLIIWANLRGGMDGEDPRPYCEVVAPQACMAEVVTELMEYNVSANCCGGETFLPPPTRPPQPANQTLNASLPRAWYGTPIRDTSCCCHPLTGVPYLRHGPRTRWQSLLLPLPHARAQTTARLHAAHTAPPTSCGAVTPSRSWSRLRGQLHGKLADGRRG